MHYFTVEPIFIPVHEETKQVDLKKVRAAITRNTILIVGSAPQYPHGAIDPIKELAEIAKEKNIPVHVDSCIGGFVLPFIEKLGYPVPPWDFRVEGVTSISADVHKYGFSAKGASVLLYRSEEYRKFQFFACSYWPGGLFVSPSALGTRPGGSIAVAWATMVSLGESGYLKIIKTVIETAKWFQLELASIPGIKIVGKPESTIVAFTTIGVNVFAVSDAMKRYGWTIECNQDSIHMTVMPPHALVKERFIQNLKESIQYVKTHPEMEKKGTAAIYGMVAWEPTEGLTEKFLTIWMQKIYSKKV